MITVGISEFRANLNKFLQKVQDGEIISLTSRGNEIAKLVPTNYAQSSAREALRKLGETAVIYDVLSPIEDDADWGAKK